MHDTPRCHWSSFTRADLSSRYHGLRVYNKPAKLLSISSIQMPSITKCPTTTKDDSLLQHAWIPYILQSSKRVPKATMIEVNTGSAKMSKFKSASSVKLRKQRPFKLRRYCASSHMSSVQRRECGTSSNERPVHLALSAINVLRACACASSLTWSTSPSC